MLQSGSMSDFSARLEAVRFLLSGSSVLFILHTTSWAGSFSILGSLEFGHASGNTTFASQKSTQGKSLWGDLCGITTGK